MDYFRVSKFNGLTGPMYGVEYTQNGGRSWITMSVHSTPEAADREMRSYVALHRDNCAIWEDLEAKTFLSDSLVGVLSERAATYKVSRDEDGKIVIEDPDVLDLYELDDVEIDPGTGTPLLPGRPTECYGNGEHEGFECCCDECAHYLACFPEHQKEINEALEDLSDLKAAELAMAEHAKDPKTYTFDEVLENLGITREELDAMPDVELEQE